MRFKPTLTLLAAAACLTVGGAQAAIVVVSGTTIGGPTFNRAFEDFSGLSGVGTAVAYSAYQFTVSVAGEYTFLTTGFVAPPATFDPFVYLYSNFNPAAPLTNGLVANDDLLGFTTSGLFSTLATNTTYTYVTTGFGNADAGQFTTVIGGPGVITQVPEPETYLMMAIGLGALGFARRYAKQA